MLVEVHSLKETLYKGGAKKINAKTLLGDITVLDEHEPLLAEIIGPEIKIVDQNENIHIINIVSGVIQVKPKSEVVVLTYSQQEVKI